MTAEPDFVSDYRRYREDVLLPVSTRTAEILQTWRTPAYWEHYRRFPVSAVPTPVQRLRFRIKRMESVVDKFRRMPDEFPGPPAIEN